MSSPTRYPNGVTTAKKTDPMGEFIFPDPTKAHVFMEDFDYFVAASWTKTETGVGSAQLADGDGGVFQIINAAADNDANFLQKVGEGWTLETGKQLWFDCLFQANEDNEADIVIGLQITDTTPLDVTDGIFFLKAAASTDINLLVEKNGTATTTLVRTAALNTNMRLSFYFDGKSSIKIFSDGIHIGTSLTTNLPDDEALTVSFGIQNGEASIKTMTVDYIMVAKER